MQFSLPCFHAFTPSVETEYISTTGTILLSACFGSHDYRKETQYFLSALTPLTPWENTISGAKSIQFSIKLVFTLFYIPNFLAVHFQPCVNITFIFKSRCITVRKTFITTTLGSGGQREGIQNEEKAVGTFVKTGLTVANVLAKLKECFDV